MALNPREEKFCQHYCETGKQGESYEVANPGVSKAVASSMAWKWLRKQKIQDRISEITKENRELCRLNREEMLEYAAGVMMTPIGEIDEYSPFCEEMSDTEHGRKLKMFSKSSAFDKIVKLCGYNEPEKLEVTADDEVKDMLRELTGARKE